MEAMGFYLLMIVAAVFVAPAVGVLNLVLMAGLLFLNRRWKKRWVTSTAGILGILGVINLCICASMYLTVAFGGA